MRWRSFGLAMLLPAALWAAAPAAPSPKPVPVKVSVPDLARRLAQYAPTPLAADLTALSAADRRVLDELVAAARPMNDIFLRQVWRDNPGLERQVAALPGSEGGAVRAYFQLNFGPWDRLAGMQPFLGTIPHPDGAGFYPEDLTKRELESWLAAHPADKERFTSTTTVIRRRHGALVAVPYSEEYADWLKPAAQRLHQAAAASANPTLKRFLELRAQAFANDDYYASDLAWMDVDAPVEVTIGPYETYEDGLFGYKAAFEAFVTVALPEQSRALARYKERLPWLERNLPIPDAQKNLTRGSESPIRVVDLVYTAGETRAGVQTIAFNLPNDERVREAKGSKKVLLRNMMRAKYDQILVPISARVLVAPQVGDVSFDAYFDAILHHELSHGLGPGSITLGGRKTEVRLELKELFSTLEEAKADVMGIYNILALLERGEMPEALRRSLEPTYVAGLFRSARFGIDEAHGLGVVTQFNYLQRKGALEVDGAGRFRAVSEKFPGAIRDLLAAMLTLQATGDYAGTKSFLADYGKPSDSLRQAIARLADLPVDIRPLYPLYEPAAAKPR
ncbi:MAG TPA: peptidase [Thermoanaerobaculia bacterium]|nr:peptidase [Thermoanaerobaculia bacterium]